MSAAAKQKQRQAAITRTTAPDALIRYVLGLLIMVLGMAVLICLIPGITGNAFRLIRIRVYGLTGMMPWPLPVLMIWTGGAMMMSCYHRINWRSILFFWITYLGALALIDMWTFVRDNGALISYIRVYNAQYRVGQRPGSFAACLMQIYDWGTGMMTPQCGGGALSMLLAWPVYNLFHYSLGTAVLVLITAASALAAFRVRVGAMIRGASDLMEKGRVRRGEKRAEAQRQDGGAPAPGPEAALRNTGALYTRDTFDMTAEDPYTPAGYGEPVREEYVPQAETVPMPPPGSSRFVPVGDGNTLYNEDFVLHPRQETRPEEQPETPKEEKGRAGRRRRASRQQEEILPDGSVETISRPVPEAEKDTRVQTEAPAEIPAEAEETVPMTEQDFMPPERSSRRRTKQTPVRNETPEAVNPAIPEAPDPFMDPEPAAPSRREKPAPAPEAPAPSGKENKPQTAQIHAPVRKEQPAPAPAPEEDDENLSDWQRQLRAVSRGLFSSQPVKMQETKAKPEVVDVDPAFAMTESVRIPSAEKKKKRVQEETPSPKPSPLRLDDTPVRESKKDNPFASLSYTPPPINFLSEPKAVNREESTQEDVRRAQQIERTLATFNIQVQVREITHGPAITRFALKIAEGVKVKQVVGVLDNIALEMGSDRLRIEAPIPGTSYIGIEVPNSVVSSVTLREVLDSQEMNNIKNPLMVALGKDIAGKPILCDLSRMPHLLIAGATGSGKSVCINSIVCSLLYRASPADVRLIMVDPKQVELQVYNGIPHLLTPVISDPKKASSALNWVVNEMFDRYGKFSQMGVRNLEGYNKKTAKEKRLPNIVVIIDEMADLMEVCRKDVEESVRRLAALARAAGIYMVLATQRPSVDVITGVIKNNIPSRIAFTVSSGVDSRTIIDVNGAEKLMGKGDMLYQPTGAPKPTRVQGCFVSDDEVARITENIVVRYRADYNTDIQNQMEQSQENGKGAQDDAPGETLEGEFNDLLTNAVRMAVEDGQTSISMLQRRLRVGYARAGRLVDEMTKMGIVSEAEGSKPRKVLITREQFMDWAQEHNAS